MLTEIIDNDGRRAYSGPAGHAAAAHVAKRGTVLTEHISCAERLQFAVDYNLAAAATGAPTRLDITRIL